MFRRTCRDARTAIAAAALPILIVQNAAVPGPSGPAAIISAAASTDDPEHSMIWD
ncbi:hypothetical protein AB0I10_13670 [Streptomyces sp. NPDC050636]|uniref:hypothetical protein n=1 Tax=Streptomyces sp. NPDC050636 TaxID=3154510 RepID=UPI00343554A5